MSKHSRKVFALTQQTWRPGTWIHKVYATVTILIDGNLCESYWSDKIYWRHMFRFSITTRSMCSINCFQLTCTKQLLCKGRPIAVKISLVESWINSNYRTAHYGNLLSMFTLINALAFVNSPNVVCLEESGPNGTISFNLSRQCRRWALLQEKTTHALQLFVA